MDRNELDALSSRVKKLERQNRSHRRATALLLVIFGTALIMGQAAPSRVVESNSFVLKDAAGKTRAALTLDSAGAVQLVLADQSERIHAQLSVANNGAAHLSLKDNKGIVRVGLAVLQDGTPDLGLADASGAVRIGLGFDKKDARRSSFMA
ncbi:MAG TPA: hypothetical protein VNL14_08235 [Candidatus Acidoferrales bacterium]|nr:hypothetical protein [Candidatus Acidoferrales bacterium]